MLRVPVASTDSTPPPEEQRQPPLEKNTFRNRALLVLVAVILTMAITVLATTLVFHHLYDTPLAEYERHIAHLNQEVATLNQHNQQQQLQLEQTKQALSTLEARLDHSSAASFQKLLIEQEASFQKFLGALKAGMRDLSNMVPGSRTWLEHYVDQLDEVNEQSLRRQRELQHLQTGERSTLENDASTNH